MNSLLQDIRYGIRQFARTPGFIFAAVIALALGIAANVVIFSTVNAVLLNSLPFKQVKQPDRLVSVFESNPVLMEFIAEHVPVRLRNFLEWRKQTKSFADMEAYQQSQFDITSASAGPAEPEQVQGVTVTPGFLPMLGVAPRLGRNFSAAEATANNHVALISDEFWRARFSGDPHILGRRVRASNAEYQIVGVLPPKFELPAAKIWIPMNLSATPDEQNRISLTVLARLRRGVTVAQARAEMRVISDRLAREHPDTNRGWGANVYSTMAEDVDPDVRQSLYVLQIAVGFVLLIACANVANLLLTKAVAREREMAVRVAIGASRFRLLRQSLTESLVLSLTAGVLGLLLSFGGLRLVTYFAPQDIHGFHELAIDPAVLAFTLGVTLVSGILFGLAPSIHAMRQSVAAALSNGSRSVTGSSRRFRAALVVFEIAMSLILLVGAGLMIRSLASLMTLDLGFRADHLLTMSIALPDYRYPNGDAVAAFDDQLLARVQHLPGVQAASLATALPMRSITEQSYALPGVPVDPNHLKVTDWSRVTDEHIQTLGLHLLRGRDLKPDDLAKQNPNVAIANQAFAHANWPGQDAIGKQFIFPGEDGKDVTYTIVGIVSNAHQFGPDATPHIEVYLPSRHMQNMSLAVRTVGDPFDVANEVKHQVWVLDKEQPVSQVDSMQNMLSEWVAPRRFTMTILIVFAAIALLLACIGLYGVLSYAVTLRTREIGVRVALGAAPGRVAGLIIRQAVGLAFAGIVIGLAGAFALTRFMQTIIFGISAFDARTFAAVSILLIVLSMLASYVPARRAARIDPTEALRSE